jgi:Glycosyltransferase
VGSWPEMIADGVTGYICPVGDVAAFCARIEQLRSAPELGRRMGERAREAAIARYDAVRMIDAYVEAFEPEASGSVVPGKAVGE